MSKTLEVFDAGTRKYVYSPVKREEAGALPVGVAPKTFKVFGTVVYKFSIPVCLTGEPGALPGSPAKSVVTLRVTTGMV